MPGLVNSTLLCSSFAHSIVASSTRTLAQDGASGASMIRKYLVGSGEDVDWQFWQAHAPSEVCQTDLIFCTKSGAKLLSR